ncbi:MAG: RHS repeat-associated core domain-containing protein [Acidobacteriota bacterium]
MWRPLPAGAFEITFYGIAGERLGTWKLLSGQLTNLSTNLYFAGKLIRQKQINAYGGVEDAAVVTDRMGSVRMRTNFGTATPDPILQNTRLYPFGEELSPATANDRDKFATYYRDNSTGLDYALNRYYGSTMGRFTTPDPSGMVLMEDPRSWNRYAYTGNDPINNVDRAGLQWELIGCEQFINIGEDQPWSVCAYRWFSSSLNMGSTAAFFRPSSPTIPVTDPRRGKPAQFNAEQFQGCLSSFFGGGGLVSASAVGPVFNSETGEAYFSASTLSGRKLEVLRTQVRTRVPNWASCTVVTLIQRFEGRSQD